MTSASGNCGRRTCSAVGRDRLAVSVEGQTEEVSVNRSLAPHLRRNNIYARPVLIGRVRRRARAGGHVSIDLLANEMRNLSNSFDAVTCVYYYSVEGPTTWQLLAERWRPRAKHTTRGGTMRIDALHVLSDGDGGW